MPTKLTSDWGRAGAMLSAAPGKLRKAIGVALRREAHVLRNEIVKGIGNQAPGGKTFEPLSKLTIATRSLRGFGGTKALIARGDLRNAIAVIARGSEVFIGVPRSARAKGGRSMINVAKVHEYGSKPTIIPITPKMRRLLHAVVRRAGIEPSGERKGAITVQIPARPFLRPAFDKFRQGASRRFHRHIAELLGFGGG